MRGRERDTREEMERGRDSSRDEAPNDKAKSNQLQQQQPAAAKPNRVQPSPVTKGRAEATNTTPFIQQYPISIVGLTFIAKKKT